MGLTRVAQIVGPAPDLDACMVQRKHDIAIRIVDEDVVERVTESQTVRIGCSPSDRLREKDIWIVREIVVKFPCRCHSVTAESRRRAKHLDVVKPLFLVSLLLFL
jgi:hypothetical protein